MGTLTIEFAAHENSRTVFQIGDWFMKYSFHGEVKEYAKDGRQLTLHNMKSLQYVFKSGSGESMEGEVIITNEALATDMYRSAVLIPLIEKEILKYY